MPWRTEFVEMGGYDSMTHAWFIYDERGRSVADIDLGSFGQSHCDYSFRSEEAERLARLIVDAVNAFQGVAR